MGSHFKMTAAAKTTSAATYLVGTVHAILGQDPGPGGGAPSADDGQGGQGGTRPTTVMLQLRRWPVDAWLFAEEAATLKRKFFTVLLPTDISKIAILDEAAKRAEVVQLNKCLPQVRGPLLWRGQPRLRACWRLGPLRAQRLRS